MIYDYAMTNLRVDDERIQVFHICGYYLRAERERNLENQILV